MTILLLSLFLFLFLGVPIAYSLGLSALCYFVVHEPGLMVVMPQRLMAGMDSYALIALPLFIFMGQLMNASGITRRLIDYCMLLVGHFRGGSGWSMYRQACYLVEFPDRQHLTLPQSVPS